MKDQERRNALVRRDVGHGREVAMLLRVIAELLSMTVGWQWQVVHAGAVSATSMIAGMSKVSASTGTHPLISSMRSLPLSHTYRPCTSALRADRPPNVP